MFTPEEKQLFLTKVTRLHALYHAGGIKTLAQHELYPDLPKDSRENYLYFTLAPCLNFQRSSPALWASAYKTYEDPATRYLFFPELLFDHSQEKIQQDLMKYGLALQKNKHTFIWMTISKTLADYYQHDPRVLLAEQEWDIVKILQTIQEEKRKYFPYLSGPKMANYWLFILHRFTAAPFKNLQEISIIPDTHVLQSSVKLGLIGAAATPQQVAAVWKELLTGFAVSPMEMHPVLWNWSRNNFLPEV